LLGLQVRDFRCVAVADVELRPGLNVLHGPNDLGKSTLATALRAGLLLQHGSREGQSHVPWGTERKPRVQVRFEVDARQWRLGKTFAVGTGGASLLEWTGDGLHWTKAEEGRGVDAEIRRLLGWGIGAPGGKKRQSGLPKSFLSSVLLGEQALPYRVFDETLDGDEDDTGRRRLTEALQALATDPLYQSVLAEAQTQVDAAFDSRGKPRTGRGSPFRGVADEIKRRHASAEELEHKVAEADAVAARLAELDVQRNRWMEKRARAEEAFERAQHDFELGQRRAQLQERVAQAQAVLDEIERNQAEIERLSTECRRLEAAVPAMTERVERAKQRRRDAEDERGRARQRLEAAREGGDAEARAVVAKLRRREVEIEATLVAARERVDAAQTWRGLVAEAEAEAERAAVARVAIEAATAEAVSRLSLREALEQEAERIDVATRWLRFARAQETVRRATAAASEAAQQRARAEQLRGDARSKLAALEARALPDAERRAQLRKLDDDLRLLRARLGGGVSVQLRLAKSKKLEARIDGGDPQAVAPDGAIDAQRDLELDLGRAGSIAIVAGEAGARREAQEARARWADVVAPVLQRAGVEDLAALAALVEAAQVEREAARQMEAEAATLLRLADAHPPGARQEAEAQLRIAEHALGDHGRDVQALAEGHDEESLAARAEAIDDELRALRRAIEAEAEARSGAEAGVQVAEERARAAAQRRDEAAAKLGPDPHTVQGEAQMAVAAAQSELDALRVDLARAEAAGSDGVRLAGEACAAAEARVQAVDAEEAGARRELDATSQALARDKAALEVRRERAREHDPFAAGEAFARVNDELAALPRPERDMGSDELEAAQAELVAARQALDDAEAEVRKQEGALQQVGGQVIREKADAAREALEAARRRQAEVELDYEGWRLLLDALREAQNEEGQHLGRALGREVGERFEALTDGRYAALQLGPDLQARGVRAGTETRPIESLSEGLKEQLATLLRVSIAQHLGGVLVLDDHLAQTDPARAGWFKQLLRDAAREIQIVVLTCRPDDYFAEGDEEIHAIDLIGVIERV
jgi:hypothetical protein